MSRHEPHPHHFILFPFMAQGHMIPMVDIARLLAGRGISVTILTTPQNSSRFKSVIDRAAAAGLDIHFTHLKFPCAAAGLPDGCDNFDMLPSMDDAAKFCVAIALLQDQVEEVLRRAELPPTCLISDGCFPWTTNVARKFDIPRIIFHGTNCFSQACYAVLADCNLFKSNSDSEYVVIPGLPDRVEITKAQFEVAMFRTSRELVEFWDQVRDAEDGAFGVLANTFEELEPKYIEKYSTTKGKKVWSIGPVSSCIHEELDMAERGGLAAIDGHSCLKWLDGHELGSVIYACLGSLSRVATAQLVELGLALEGSGRPFIWAVRSPPAGFRTWLVKEKFEERVGGRGVLIVGWAPQVVILSHRSVGGFLTHCGWNSTLEGIAAGTAMVTWPVLGEQFLNERFVVDVVRTGVRVGVEKPVGMGHEEEVGVQVDMHVIKGAIEDVMDGGDYGKERRRRAAELAAMANAAVASGGSSCRNLTRFVRDVLGCKGDMYN
ncbi:UDP-glycosyltransferase 73E1-like [Andrographis paniculata]|uniref:UDP-glycosyltransferase 73E1-like n=1 Tax=Andrographis paniculata TaxID=175694 RepID=UPI001E717A34|nr:UDP-glycosyltransferase 73E1-like [Andrographis paniculata]QZJ84692.1 UDP-glycosyltransferase 21 [Andrographis paniculata]